METQHTVSLNYLMAVLHIKLWTREDSQPSKNYFGCETRTPPVTNNTSNDSGWGDEETVQENIKYINWSISEPFEELYFAYIYRLSHLC